MRFYNHTDERGSSAGEGVSSARLEEIESCCLKRFGRIEFNNETGDTIFRLSYDLHNPEIGILVEIVASGNIVEMPAISKEEADGISQYIELRKRQKSLVVDLEDVERRLRQVREERGG